jgi:chromosome segregation ATPase
MAAEGTSPAEGFAIVRRGYDPDQVTEHLHRADVEAKVLLTDRDTAVARAEWADRELAQARGELDRLQGEVRALKGTPQSVGRLSERLDALFRLAHDEYGDLQATAATYTREAIAALEEQIGGQGPAAGDAAPLVEERPTDPAAAQREIDRLYREAAQERARLHEAALAERERADEEFRTVLALRARAALTQLARQQADALRISRQVLDDVDAKVRERLAVAAEQARAMIADAQREVDDLHAVRDRLRSHLDSARSTLDTALPAELPPDPAPAAVQAPEAVAPARVVVAEPAPAELDEPATDGPATEPASDEPAPDERAVDPPASSMPTPRAVPLTESHTVHATA